MAPVSPTNRMMTFFPIQNGHGRSQRNFLLVSQKQIVSKSGGMTRPSALLAKAPTKAIKSDRSGTVMEIKTAFKRKRFHIESMPKTKYSFQITCYEGLVFLLGCRISKKDALHQVL